MFLGGYPNSVLVFDEARERWSTRFTLATGLPISLRLSQDRKKIYVITNDHSGIEVIDVATRKVTNHFVLNTPTKHYRFSGGTPDPEGKLLYTIYDGNRQEARPLRDRQTEVHGHRPGAAEDRKNGGHCTRR